MHDLVIRRGLLVSPAGVNRYDIGIADGQIVELSPEISGGVAEIAADGLHIFPGFIDDHVHFNEPGHGDWEGAATGSRALAAGGGTMFFDMPLNSIPCTVSAKEFHRKRQALEQAAVTDFALWGGLIPGSIGAMAELADAGVIGFKAFMCNSGLPEFPRADDFTLYEGVREAARLGLPVAVHAENEEITAQLAKSKLEADQKSVCDYLDSRPVFAEVEAIQRACLMAADTGVRLQIVHVSSGRGVVAALQARAQGADITIETCAHYLHFTDADVERLGAIAKCAPPLRNAADQQSLWSHVLAGDIDVIASDHSPAPPSMKTGADFFKIWGGISGVQSVLSVLLEDGYFRRRLPLENIVKMTATNPACRFRLSGKGSLVPGADADLCLIDLASSNKLATEQLFQRYKTSPYVGSHFRGVVRRTILRGKTIFVDGTMTVEGFGHLVRPDIRDHAKSRTHS